MHFPKDTNPNAISRFQQVQGMSLQTAKASLLQAKAQLDASGLFAWWQKLCETLQVDMNDRVLAAPVGPTTPSLNDAIREYDRTFTRLRFDLAFFTVRKSLGYAKLRPYIPILVPLFQEVERRTTRRLPEVPPRVFSVLPSDVVSKINKMCRYTAMNAAQFENVPPAALLKRCLNQVWAADQDESRKEGLGKSMQYAKIIGRCSSAKLATILGAVEEGRGAVCTSFAGAVASVLTSGRRGRPYRVEMISGPNHCFCLVNRAAAAQGMERPDTSGATLMPAKDFWGPDVIVVDAWAGALGHAVFYNSPADFPKVLQVYLTSKLLQHYDSAQDA